MKFLAAQSAMAFRLAREGLSPGKREGRREGRREGAGVGVCAWVSERTYKRIGRSIRARKGAVASGAVIEGGRE